MLATMDDIKKLREMTGCGVMECKRALQEAKGEFPKAKEILLQRGMEMAIKKSSREAKEGRVEAYIHLGSKIGVMLEVCCETDFVARNEDFCRFTKDVAMHIAACAPKYIKKEDVPADVLAAETDPEAFVKEKCLLHQAYVKDASLTIQDYLNTLVAKLGENLFIHRFCRYKVGSSE